jgi:ribosome-associated toxin RatA of RatAB toxin-antitoxin module
MELDCNNVNFFKILTNYKDLIKYLPRQLKKVDVLEENDTYTIIEVTLSFKTLIKKEITQKIKIEKRYTDSLFIQVLDGHANNTIIRISIIPNTEKSLVKVEIDLKLSLKAKILSPIIKREYKQLLTGVFRKMENDAKGNLEVI